MNSSSSSSNSTTISANPYAGGWTGFEVLLSASVLFSGTTFLLTHLEVSNTSFHARLVKYLSGQDFVWSLLCLIQCCINTYYEIFYGGTIACQLQSIYMLFFILMNGFTVCIMAYSTERRVYLTQRGIRLNDLESMPENHSYLQSRKSIFLAHLACWTLSAGLAISTNVGLDSATLEPSATFCFLSLNNRYNSILLFLPLLCFGLFLGHRYHLIFAFVVGRHRNLIFSSRQSVSKSSFNSFVPPSPSDRKEGEERPARISNSPSSQNNNNNTPTSARQDITHMISLEKKLAKRMVLYVLAYLLCTLPSGIISFCQVISSDLWISTDPVLYLIAAHFMHLSAIVNPLLYAWLNAPLRKQLLHTLLSWEWAPTKRKKAKRRVPTTKPPGKRFDFFKRRVFPEPKSSINAESLSQTYELQLSCCCFHISTKIYKNPSPDSSMNAIHRARAMSFDTAISAKALLLLPPTSPFAPFPHGPRTPLELANLPEQSNFTFSANRKLRILIDSVAEDNETEQKAQHDKPQKGFLLTDINRMRQFQPHRLSLPNNWRSPPSPVCFVNGGTRVL